MRWQILLLAIAAAGLVNGLGTDEGFPLWREAVCLAIVIIGYPLGRRRIIAHGGLVLGVVALAAVAVGALDVWEGVTALVVFTASVVLPWGLGRFRRQEVELAASDRERIRALEHERELVVDRTRLQERSRLAAEMHDSLGHELTLISVRAGALELSAVDDGVRNAAEGLRGAATSATDRLREALGFLRGASGHDGSSGAADESINVLVDRAAEAGMSIRLTLSVDAADLPALVARTMHRVVQEGLTNAARHAPGMPVEVTAEEHHGELVVRVSNPVDDDSGSRPPSVGTGLAGLRERTELLGGRFEAGRGESGRGDFTVVARLAAVTAASGGRR